MEKNYTDKVKPQEVRKSNIVAAKAVADVVRTSLGPRGMDKMIQNSKGEVIITNDGATILKHMSILNPAARMLVDLSAAQDIEAGDGTTSVVVLAGSLLVAAEKLLEKGIHPTIVAEAFIEAAQRAVEVLTDMAVTVDLNNFDALVQAATTSLSSKVVSQYSSLLAPIAVKAVLRVADLKAHNVDLRDIKLITRVGGTIDETKMYDGLVLTQHAAKSANGPTRMEKAKIAVVQFQLSPPKTDMENQVVVNDYRQMDKILKEERTYLLNMCKKIKKTGANVLLIQKSILRDATNELSLHFLSKLKIMVVKEIERDDIEFICKSTGCKPIADIESFTEDKLGSADLVEESENLIKFSSKQCRTCSIVVRGANDFVLQEAERSIHDALCVIRCLVKKNKLIAGGGAPEIEVSSQLSKLSKQHSGMKAFCFQNYADALEIIPETLAENAGLNPIAILTELRNRHAQGQKTAGINVRKGCISDILDENVIQPLLVSTCAFELASDTVRMVLKIDDIIASK